MNPEGSFGSSPYRTLAKIEQSYSPPKYGLLYNKPEPIHICPTPGFFKRVFYALTFRSIPKESLFRCPECKQVYILRLKWSDTIAKWLRVNNEVWIENGGIQ